MPRMTSVMTKDKSVTEWIGLFHAGGTAGRATGTSDWFFIITRVTFHLAVRLLLMPGAGSPPWGLPILAARALLRIGKVAVLPLDAVIDLDYPEGEGPLILEI